MNLADVSDAEWKAIVSRLTLYADNKLKRRVWRGISGRLGGSPAGGICPEDLAAEAVVDLLEGRRVWDANQKPELIDFLRDVVDSKISHLVNSKENRIGRQLDGSMTDAEVTAVFLDPSLLDRPVDEKVSDAEQVARLCESIRMELADDDVATQLFRCCLDGVSKPAEMAVILELPVKTIYDAQKRMRRGVERTLVRMQNEERIQRTG